MEERRDPVLKVIGSDMPERLAALCHERSFGRLRLVADDNTWRALGQRTATCLRASSIDVERTILGGPVEAGEVALRHLAVEDSDGRLLVSIGSGTITDLVRYHAHLRGRDFLCMPTAASVDAYSSTVSALIVDGVKETRAARPPLAILADLDAILSAPAAMTAAGFGDMVCKYSALADWRLGALLWDEPWEPEVAVRMRAAAQACTKAAASIGRGEAEGLAVLMSGLLESGSAMAATGHSRPASGAEHHLSHFWEMRLMAEGRPPILHGLKVGVATAITASLWEGLRRIGRAELEERLSAAVLPDREGEESRIREDFGTSAPAVIASHRRFLDLDEAGFSALKRKIRDNWDEISGLAASVPGEAETEAFLQAAGCPRDPSELGLGAGEVAAAARSAHYLRDRFTVRKLVRMLGLAA